MSALLSSRLVLRGRLWWLQQCSRLPAPAADAFLDAEEDPGAERPDPDADFDYAGLAEAMGSDSGDAAASKGGDEGGSDSGGDQGAALAGTSSESGGEGAGRRAGGAGACSL